MTRFFPACLAAYMASSARLVTETWVSPGCRWVTPALKVISRRSLFMQEDASGQFPLQADNGRLRIPDRRVRQDDDELLATKAGNRVLRTHRLPNHGGQVYQGRVAGVVAERVVEFLEVVNVEQGHAEGRLATLRTRDFLLECLLKTAAVECTGQLVMTNQRAGAVEFHVAVRRCAPRLR
jgi:hypothetical protein